MTLMNKTWLHRPATHTPGQQWTDGFIVYPGYAAIITGFGFLNGHDDTGSNAGMAKECLEFASLYTLDIETEYGPPVNNTCGCKVLPRTKTETLLATPEFECGCRVSLNYLRSTLIISRPGTYAFLWNERDAVLMPARVSIRILDIAAAHRPAAGVDL